MQGKKLFLPIESQISSQITKLFPLVPNSLVLTSNTLLSLLIIALHVASLTSFNDRELCYARKYVRPSPSSPTFHAYFLFILLPRCLQKNPSPQKQQPPSPTTHTHEKSTAPKSPFPYSRRDTDRQTRRTDIQTNLPLSEVIRQISVTQRTVWSSSWADGDLRNFTVRQISSWQRFLFSQTLVSPVKALQEVPQSDQSDHSVTWQSMGHWTMQSCVDVGLTLSSHLQQQRHRLTTEQPQQQR